MPLASTERAESISQFGFRMHALTFCSGCSASHQPCSLGPEARGLSGTAGSSLLVTHLLIFTFPVSCPISNFDPVSLDKLIRLFHLSASNVLCCLLQRLVEWPAISGANGQCGRNTPYRRRYSIALLVTVPLLSTKLLKQGVQPTEYIEEEHISLLDPYYCNDYWASENVLNLQENGYPTNS